MPFSGAPSPGGRQFAFVHAPRSVPVVVLVLGLTLVAPAPARGPVLTVRDHVGDGVGAAADIESLRVWSDGRRIVFRIAFADRRTLEPDDLVAVVLDTDANSATGFPFLERRGIDAVLVLEADGGMLVHLDGMVTVLDAAATGAGSKGVTVELDRADLGAPRSFGVAAASMLRSDPDARDETALERFAAPLHRRVVGSFLTIEPPVAPRVGSLVRARVALRLDDGTTVVPSTLACRMTLGARVVRPASRCRWRLPEASRAKRVVVGARGTYLGSPFAARSLAVRVRR